MTVINLIPHEILRGRDVRRRLRAWGMRLVVTAMLLAAAYAGFDRLALGRSSEVHQLDGECLAMRQDLGSAGALIQERDRLLARRQTIAAIQDRVRTGALLSALGAALTARSYLTFLAVERCAPLAGDDDAAGCRGRVQLRGRAPGHREVGRLIQQLEDSGAFSSVTLRTISDPLAAAGGGVEFDLFCSLEEAER
jgi:Tfp pilus assembly protein PilN